MRQSLFIGDYRFREFRDTIDWLKHNSWLALAIDIDDAISRVRKQRLRPEFVIFAQSHPGQYPRVAVERLYGWIPLARLVVVLGSWCESETRTGDPWPGVPRFYWHQFATRADRAYLCGDDAAAIWRLPRTSTPAEWLLAETATGSSTAHRRLLAIRTVDLEAYRALSDELNAEGYATLWVPAGRPPFVRGQAAGIWDSARLDSREICELKQFTQRLAPAPVIALVNFPRLTDCQRIASAGASAVLGKPWLAPDLLHLLARNAGTSAEPVHDAFAA